MKIVFDEEAGTVTSIEDESEAVFGLDSAKAFELLSHAWIRSGWDTKYVYSFSWMGRPLIQLPEDMIRIQEVIFEHKPDVIIETGVAHGGSLVFYASLLKAMGNGRVIGVEIDLRSQNRHAINDHILKPLINIVDGSSIAEKTVAQVSAQIKKDDRVMVILDSNHTKEHVLEELRLYGELVTPGCYIVATDGVMEQVAGAPRTEESWSLSNPKRAAIEFASKDRRFEIIEPEWPFNEGDITKRVTYWPSAFVKRIQ